MAVAKRQRKEKHTNGTKENPKTGLRISGKQTALLASPVYIGQAQREEKNHIKRGAEIEPLSSFGSASPHTSRMYFPLSAKKTGLN